MANTIQLFTRLQSALAASATDAISAIGIDLGTTKSCAAVARFDPDTKRITCDCIAYSADVIAQINSRIFIGATRFTGRSHSLRRRRTVRSRDGAFAREQAPWMRACSSVIDGILIVAE